MNKTIPAIAVSAVLLAGCGSVNTTETKETKKSYVIYDIKVEDSVSATDMSQAIKKALQDNTNSVKIVEDLPPYPLPDESPRFQLTSPFGNKSSGIAALAGNIKIPTCNGALVYAQATNDSMSSYGENTRFYTCLWQYKGGYHVDIYTEFEIESGGMHNLGVDLARNISGDSSQFIPKTINNIRDNLEALNAEAKVIAAYPQELVQELNQTN